MRALEKEPDRRYHQASHFKSGFESVGEMSPNRVPAPPFKPVVRPNGTRCMVTLMSGREKKGNWRPGDPQIAMTMWGGTCLDLTDVKVKDVNLTLLTLMGAVEVIVPHGATVDLDGFILMGATVDNVAHGDGPSTMNVRVKSWGAMGGCEIRTPTQKELAIQNKSAKPPRKPQDHEVTFAGGLVLLYKLITMLVTIAIPIIFLGIPFSGFPEQDCIVLGILTSLACGFLWAALGFFRIMIGAGPEGTDEKSIQEYESATKLGALIRVAGLVFAFACPVLIILSVFDTQYIGYFGDFQLSEDTLRFVGIGSAIFSGLIFAAAEFLEEFLYGKR